MKSRFHDEAIVAWRRGAPAATLPSLDSRFRVACAAMPMQSGNSAGIWGDRYREQRQISGDFAVFNSPNARGLRNSAAGYRAGC